MSKVDIKAVLLGQHDVGKSCILWRYVRNNFKDNITATVGAAFVAKRVEVDELAITLGIWDTAGAERYESLSRIYYRSARAAIICYDVTNVGSWEKAKSWIDEVLINEENAEIYIVGNKSDKLEEGETDFMVVNELAAKIGAHTFQVSAKTGENISLLFNTIATNWLKAKTAPRRKEKEVVLLQEPNNKNKVGKIVDKNIVSFHKQSKLCVSCKFDRATKQLSMANCSKINFKHTVRHNLLVTTVDISNNNLTDFPGWFLASFDSLTSLDISSNKISALPDLAFPIISKLHILDISNNRLQHIAIFQFASFTSLQSLNVTGNKISNIPANLQSPSCILKYLQQDVASGLTKNKWSRLFICGQFGTGKTTIRRKLEQVNETKGLQKFYKAPALSTVGIDIINLEVTSDSDATNNVQCWDFAGQRIYYISHHLFMKNCGASVLVFVWNQNCKAEDSAFSNWLQSMLSGFNIQSDSTKEIGIIMVGTHKDQISQSAAVSWTNWLTYCNSVVDKLGGVLRISNENDDIKDVPTNKRYLFELKCIGFFESSLAQHWIQSDKVATNELSITQIPLQNQRFENTLLIKEQSTVTNCSFMKRIVNICTEYVIVADPYKLEGSIPNSFSPLLLRLLHIQEASEHKILWYNELAENLQMDSSTLSRALLFLHSIGMVYYISDITATSNASVNNGVIFTNPKWLVDMVAVLFAFKHKRIQRESESDNRKINFSAIINLKEINKADIQQIGTGVLQKPLLEKLYAKLMKKAGIKHVDFCISLLQHFGLLIESDKADSQQKTYLCPALVTRQPAQLSAIIKNATSLQSTQHSFNKFTLGRTKSTKLQPQLSMMYKANFLLEMLPASFLAVLFAVFSTEFDKEHLEQPIKTVKTKFKQNLTASVSNVWMALDKPAVQSNSSDIISTDSGGVVITMSTSESLKFTIIARAGTASELFKEQTGQQMDHPMWLSWPALQLLIISKSSFDPQNATLEEAIMAELRPILISKIIACIDILKLTSGIAFHEQLQVTLDTMKNKRGLELVSKSSKVTTATDIQFSICNNAFKMQNFDPGYATSFFRHIPLPKLFRVDLTYHYPNANVCKVLEIHNNRLKGQYVKHIKSVGETENLSLYFSELIPKDDDFFSSNTNNTSSSNVSAKNNELLLFHGTSWEGAFGILQNGFNKSHCRLDAALGQGIYFSDNSCKALNYATCSNCGSVASCLSTTSDTIQCGNGYSCRNGLYCILVCRVAVGHMFTGKVSKKRRHASSAPAGYDSIFAKSKQFDTSSAFVYNEVCVYDNAACYPQYALFISKDSAPTDSSDQAISLAAANNNNPSDTINSASNVQNKEECNEHNNSTKDTDASYNKQEIESCSLDEVEHIQNSISKDASNLKNKQENNSTKDECVELDSSNIVTTQHSLSTDSAKLQQLQEQVSRLQAILIFVAVSQLITILLLATR